MKHVTKILTVVALLCMATFAPSACASTAVAVTGKTITFSYTADGTQPFRQQWQKDGVPIAGATAPTFVIQTAKVTDAGTYTVVVTNDAGSATSDNATLSFIVAPNNIITGVQVTVNGVTKFYPIT